MFCIHSIDKTNTIGHIWCREPANRKIGLSAFLSVVGCFAFAAGADTALGGDTSAAIVAWRVGLCPTGARCDGQLAAIPEWSARTSWRILESCLGLGLVAHRPERAHFAPAMVAALGCDVSVWLHVNQLHLAAIAANEPGLSVAPRDHDRVVVSTGR
jgi:hypothetical protein